MKTLKKFRYTQEEADAAQKKFMDKFNSDFTKCKNRKQRKRLYVFKCYNCERSITWNHVFIGVDGTLCKSCVDAALNGSSGMPSKTEGKWYEEQKGF